MGAAGAAAGWTASATESCASATSQLAAAQERLATQATQLDNALRELRDAAAAFATQRDVDAREVQAQTRLSELYQRTTNEERARVTALQQTIAALEVSPLLPPTDQLC